MDPFDSDTMQNSAKWNIKSQKDGKYRIEGKQNRYSQGIQYSFKYYMEKEWRELKKEIF